MTLSLSSSWGPGALGAPAGEAGGVVGANQHPWTMCSAQTDVWGGLGGSGPLPTFLCKRDSRCPPTRTTHCLSPCDVRATKPVSWKMFVLIVCCFHALTWPHFPPSWGPEEQGLRVAHWRPSRSQCREDIHRCSLLINRLRSQKKVTPLSRGWTQR